MVCRQEAEVNHDRALKEELDPLTPLSFWIIMSDSHHGYHDRGPEGRHLSGFFSWGRVRTQLSKSFYVRACCLIISVLEKR